MTLETADALATLQQLLDIISDQPGAILYRGTDRWRVALPTQVGDVLTLSSDLLPEWQPPA